MPAGMKPDGQGYGHHFLPAGTGAGTILNPEDSSSRAKKFLSSPAYPPDSLHRSDMWDLQANICIYTRFVVNMYLHISCNALWFMYMLNLAGTRACPRAFHARGWRARAWFVARGGSRARARDLAGGRVHKKVVSAGITPAAIFSGNW